MSCNIFADVLTYTRYFSLSAATWRIASLPLFPSWGSLGPNFLSRSVLAVFNESRSQAAFPAFFCLFLQPHLKTFLKSGAQSSGPFSSAPSYCQFPWNPREFSTPLPSLDSFCDLPNVCIHFLKSQKSRDFLITFHLSLLQPPSLL